MKYGKTLTLIFFFVFVAFVFPELQETFAAASFTGTLAPLIEYLPLIFLAVAGVAPFISFIGEKDGG